MNPPWLRKVAGAAPRCPLARSTLTNHPLPASDIPNLIVTPHTAWLSDRSRNRLLAGVTANIRSFLAGNPVNRVA